MVRIAGAGGFDDNIGVAAQVFLHQARLNRAHRHWRRHRQTLFADGAVGQHQQHRAIAHHALRFITQRMNSRFQRLLRRVEGTVQRIGAIIFAFQRRQLTEVGEKQNRRFKRDAVRLAFRFAENIHFAADAGGQRHHVILAQRINRRVSHLSELLTEIVINEARAAGENRKRRIIAH